MSFAAKSGKHAIVEVVFGLRLSRPWHEAEIKKLDQKHDRWKDDLPRRAQHEIQQIIVGEGMPQAITLPGAPGISFERIKPNGDLAWRLQCQGDSLTVNCLEYTRWQDAWAKVSGYMRRVFEIVKARDVSIKGALLQYIDVFDWTADPKEYDVFQLLDVNSEYVPKVAGSYDMTWHLYQGCFIPVSRPTNGRMLQKVHFDAVRENETGQPTVKLDTVLRSDFEDCISAQTFLEEESTLERVFVDMHDRNKKILQDFLTKTVCENIGLGGNL